MFRPVPKKIRAYWRYTRPLRQVAKVRFLRIMMRLVPNESQRVFLLTLVIGAVCGLVAVLFHLSIIAAEGYLIDPAAEGQIAGWAWMTVLVPAGGGLLSGILLYFVFPGSRGSGIPQVKVAYEIKGGRLPFRDAIGKFLVGVMQIGSGASLGREGPTVHICAGVASFFGRTAALSQINLRRILPVGVAAGIAAAFNAPIAAVTFTIEEVVGDLDQTVLSGVIVAAAIAAAIERSILGEHPVFTITANHGLHYASSLIFYAILGILAGGASLLFSESLLRLRKWFAGLTAIPMWARPSIGGLVTGLLALVAFYFFNAGGVTGGGYNTLSTALTGSLAIRAMAVLCLFKIAATVFSYSSGGAGGIFAPALFVGGMLGGIVGYMDVGVFHHPDTEVGAFALVGMGAVFAGVIRAPITSVLIIFEMTGSYGLILPLMIANMTSYALAKRYRKLPIYEALLEQDGIYLGHRKDSAKHALEKQKVDDAMTSDVVAISGGLTVLAASKKFGGLDYSVFPVIDDEGRCIGSVTNSRLERNLAEGKKDLKVRAIADRAVFVYPDQSLSLAIVKMNQEKVIKLFVVERKSRNKLLGMLTMSDIVRMQASAFDESKLEWSAAPNEV